MNRPAIVSIPLLLSSVLSALACSSLALAAKPVAPEKPLLLAEQDLQTAAFLRDAVRDDNKAWAVLESLTTEVGPRLAGSEGNARAVEWGQKKLQQLGFDKVWTEPVHYPTWQRGVETAEITSPYPQKLIITALGNSVGTTESGLTAPIIAFDTLEALKAAPDNVAKGKIVLITKTMKKFRNGADYGPTVGARSAGAVEAAKKGAVGFLIRSVGTDHDRLPHTGNMHYAPDVTAIPAAALSNPDADQLQRILKRGQEVQVHLTMGSHAGPEYQSANVIGEIRGSEKPDEYIILGGHLDSWDLGTGALDDGAGVAISVGAVEAIKHLGLTPKRSIRVILFADEEQGLYGGQQYAEAHKNEQKKIIAAAEADFGAGPVYRMDTHVKVQSLAVVAQMMSVLKPLNIASGDNAAGDGPDLRGLHANGTALFSLELDGTDYFNYHHTPNDTLDKVDPESLKQSTAAYATWAWLAAQAPDDFGFSNIPTNDD